MAHLKIFDSGKYTVIMVQVENEVGLMGDSRDRSGLAERRFAENVPTSLLEMLKLREGKMSPAFKRNFPSPGSDYKPNQSWDDTFGKSESTDELFMAYYYATYCEAVANRGTQAYPLPLYTNAALRNDPLWLVGVAQEISGIGGGVRPGLYPTGGPVETVLDIWHYFAPTLQFLAPDIYLNDYPETCRLYSHGDQPLFIPEQRRDEYGALRIWEAIGTYNAIATSPFGIDTDSPMTSPFTHHYELIKKFSGIILRARTKGYDMCGFFFDRYERSQPNPSPGREVKMGDWHLHIKRAHTFGQPDPGFGIVIRTSANNFLLLGEGYSVGFDRVIPAGKDPVFTGLIGFWEKGVTNEETGELETLRTLNGDEVGNGSWAIMASATIDLGGFCIPAFIPAKTRIAEVEVYFLD